MTISSMPYKYTSAATEDHKETLAHLIQITENCVYEHVASEASMMTSIAQRRGWIAASAVLTT